MRIILRTANGKNPSQGIKELLDKVLKPLFSSGSLISKSLTQDVKDHVQERYPSSKHYSPSKVSEGENSSGAGYSEGSSNIDIAGITRAYHDITVLPIRRQYLSIPMHQSAYGKNPREENNLFVWKSKNGSLFLAKNEGKELTLMWHLAKRAFQRQDETLMPTDDSLSQSVFQKISDEIRKR